MFLTVGLSAAAGCGSRTGLLVPESEGESSPDAASDSERPEGDSAAGGGDGGVFCSLYLGVVSSCDAGAQAGPVQRCTADFPTCAEPPGFSMWGCCVANPPNGLNNCVYNQVLDAAGACM